MNDSWQKGPLGETLEGHLGRRANGTGWQRGMANWNGMRAELRMHGSSFIGSLSVSQRNSLRLLLEWWDAECQREHIMQVTKEVLLQHAQGDNHENRVPMDLDLNISRYHKALFELLLYEFYFYGQSTAAPIQLRRHQASVIAACQRHAFPILGVQDKDRLSPFSERYPGMRSNTPSAVRGPETSQPVGAIIEACPWLTKEQKQGMPYFLWSIKGKQTIRVDEMKEAPPYCVVSHTWGRWRIENEAANIEGVPWKVPKNSRFEVEDLPAMLEAFKAEFLPATYIWLDLLCIPQDGSQLADREIARQAAIFASATKAMVWLNDITDWSGMQTGLRSLAIRYLQISCPSEAETAQRIAQIEKGSRSSTQLFKSFEHSSPTRGIGSDPCGWFTSLWTLQESFLRPEMTVHNLHWKPLKMINMDASPVITLDTILALVNFDKDNSTPEDDAHITPAGNEITALIHHGRFDLLLEYSPLTALILASRRQCTERRAEAIMSVFGATKWFVQASRAKRELHLVFDSYPINFVREVRDIIGTNFFCSWYVDCGFWDIFQTTESGDVEAIPAGTLLPFDKYRLGSKHVAHVASPGVMDHDSVWTWVLGDDGTVHMPEASIVASSEDDGNQEPIIATITCPITPGGDLEIAVNEDLRQLLVKIFPGVPKYAVCLQYNTNGWTRGVILMRVFDDEDPPKTLAKLGDYYTASGAAMSEPGSRSVNWDVL